MKKITLMIMMLTGIMAFDNASAQNVQVANLAELREQTADDGTVYELTGEAILTYQQSFRNQKYVQDDTGGILIDDNSGVITTTYDVYDGITGLTGTLTIYGNMMQFVPSVDPGTATSEDNVVVPIEIDMVEYLANYMDYQSRLVTITNVSFSNPGEDFANGQVYEFTDGTNVANFRTTFYGVDYIGTPIPAGPFNITGLPNSRSDGDYFSARSAADFESLVSYDITFTVIDEQNNAINDAVITLLGQTNAAGDYFFANIPGGTHPYTAVKTGFYTREGTISVSDDNITGEIVMVEISADLVDVFPWEEDFESGTFPPANWNHYALGAGGWATTDVVNAGVKAAWHNFNATAADSWLVTPQIQLGADDNVLLKFFQKNGLMDFYGYSGVMISTGSGNPEHGDFVEVYESSTGITTYTERIIGLGDYAGQTIYIAFVYQGENAHQWLIDDVVIEDAPEAIVLSTLAELRDVEIGGDLIYEISGEVVITHMHGQRNQKYVQDATAAVVIDDPDGLIETAYNLYDGITGIKGKVSSYNGLLQLTPSEDPGAASSTDNVVTPLLVTMIEITPAHQSMLLAIADVEFDTDATTIEPGTNYSVTDGTATLIMRPPSSSAALDYFGTSIPTQPVNMIVIGSIFGQDLQFFPRSLADIDVELSAEGSLMVNSVNVFPNPFEGFIRMEGLENIKQVVVLNALGQTIQTINNPSQIITLNTDSYKQGIYFVRFVYQDGNQSVNKLIRR